MGCRPERLCGRAMSAPRPAPAPAPPPASPRSRRSTSRRWRRRRSRRCSTNSTSTASARRSTDVEYADAEVDFFDDLVKGVDARRDELDALIAGKLAEGWSLARLDKPMQADPARRRLRAASPAPTCRPASVISEYVDVAKAFYDERETGFVNGLLDAIAKEVRAERRSQMDEDERRIRLHRLAARAGHRSGGARAARRRGGAGGGRRDAGPHPRHDRRGRPLSARRPARGRRLEAGRGEPVRPRRQGRAARSACCSATRSATATGTRPSSKGWRARSAPSACRCSAATRSRMPAGAPRVLGLTAIGAAAGAGAGARRRAAGRPSLGQRHDRRCRRRADAARSGAGRARRPGRALSQSAPAARGGRSGSRRSSTAMMDVSDGLLIDAARMAAASGCRGRDRARRAAPVRRLARRRRRRPRRPARRGHGGRRLRAAVRRAAGRRATAILASPRRSACPCRASAPSTRGAGLALTDDGEAGAACPIVSASSMAADGRRPLASDGG